MEKCTVKRKEKKEKKVQSTETEINLTSKNSANAYRQQDILLSSPEKQVLHVFDAAIQSCNQKNQTSARKAVVLLIDSLDFEQGKDIALGLLRLYEYCLRLIHEGNFELTRDILKELRQTWQTAISRNAA